jgi:hypothetical protein
MPAREMAMETLPQKEVGQQFSGETAELNFVAGWQVEAIEERNMGDRVDMSI